MTTGVLAAEVGMVLPLQVLQSRAGFYLGTEHCGMPFSRESEEYWPTEAAARAAMKTGCWTQKESP